MKSLKTFIGILIIFLILLYWITNSDLYETNELNHLDDRIKFGRLEYHRKADITVGNLQIHNRLKIFTINFHNQPIFVGQMEHFLVLMEAKATAKDNGGNIFDIQDDIQKICKIQRLLSIYPDEQTLTVELQGSFQDCKDAQYKIILRQTADNKLNIHIQAPQKYQRAYLFFHHEESNHYYGLGQQFSYLNLGHDRPFSTLTRQKGIGRGKQPLTFLANLLYEAGGSYFTTEAPAPIWISSKRDAYILNSHNYMAWINNKVLVWSNNFTITLIKQKTYKQLIRQISKINGYTSPVPKWVNQGAILGLQGNPGEILKKYSTLKQQGAKIMALQLEDWVSKRQALGYSKYWLNYQISDQNLKDWNKLTKQLETDGVQILIQISSILIDPTSNPKVKKNLFKIAQQMGYFVKLNNNETFETKVFNQHASLIDFQNEEAVKFFKYLIQHALNDTAANGLMADFSQAYPVQFVTQTIQEGVKRHNEYPNIYLKKVNKIISEIRGQNNNFYIFSKAGHLNSPKYTGSLWTGDHSMNFDFHSGLSSCLTAILSSGLVGYSNTHCDIGGHIGFQRKYVSSVYRSQLLLLRWMQLSAFTSIFRNHQENLPQSTLEVYSNKFLARSFGFYSRVFEILSKYRNQQSQKSQNQGLPLVRALFLQLNGMTGTQEIMDQFYLGEQILVAPYLGEQNERKYLLPKGQWKLIWDGKIFKGCDCERRWKDILPPVFIRSSSKFSEQIIKDLGELIQKYKDVVYEVSSNASSDL